MMADLGSIVGSLAVGQVAEHASFGWAFMVSGGILLAGGDRAGCSRRKPDGRPPVAHRRRSRALGPEAGGEVP